MSIEGFQNACLDVNGVCLCDGASQPLLELRLQKVQKEM